MSHPCRHCNRYGAASISYHAVSHPVLCHTLLGHARRERSQNLLRSVNLLGRQDTGDTRETPAIDVCKGLIGDGAKLNIYDPQVLDRTDNFKSAKFVIK